MAKHKILMSRVIHRPDGFLVFNEGKSEEVPDDLKQQFIDEDVIAGTKSTDSGDSDAAASGTRSAAAPRTGGKSRGSRRTGRVAPRGGVPSDASNSTRTGGKVDGTASTGGTVGGTTDAPAE